VLTALVDAQQASKREEQKHRNDYRRKKKAATFIQSSWRRLLAKKEFYRLQKKDQNLSIILVNDSRMNHLEERRNDTIRAMKNNQIRILT
jgi:hypothetical protein